MSIVDVHGGLLFFGVACRHGHVCRVACVALRCVRVAFVLLSRVVDVRNNLNWESFLFIHNTRTLLGLSGWVYTHVSWFLCS